MKKKIATLLMFLFCCVSIFTGCNLFDTNNYASLNSIVATSGKIEITREQLINAYNSSGYYYDNYYGYTREEAIKQTIKDLIDRQYILNYVKELEKTDSRYALTEAEKYLVIEETWKNVDSSIETIVEQVKKDLNLSSTDLSTEEGSTEPKFAAKTVYKSKFVEETFGNESKVVKVFEGEDTYVPKNKTQYDYELKLSSSNKDYETIVWNRYITALKRNQKDRYSDTSDNATFKREIDRLYKTNLENAILTKFQKIYTDSFGLDYDKENGVYYVNDTTLQSIVSKYQSTYSSNKALYDLSYVNNNADTRDDELNLFYNTVTNSSSRPEYFYYGQPTDSEKLLTCMHILVKIEESQTNQIKEYEEDPLLQGELEALKKEVKSQKNTNAYERSYDSEGKETISTTGTSVETLFNNILEDLKEITVSETNADYVQQAVEIFDEYIYKFNQDEGIMNAKFDYVVGTETSGMVKSFTDVVRFLYNGSKGADLTPQTIKSTYDENVSFYFPKGVGYAGAVSAPFLEEASNYSGYHIVMFTGVLENVPAENISIENVYSTLSKVKTSIAYNQNVFELIFEQVSKDNYSTHQKNLLSSIKKETTFNVSNFSDMY